MADQLEETCGLDDDLLDWVLQFVPDSLDNLDGDLRLLNAISVENPGHEDVDPSSLVAIPAGLDDIGQFLLGDEADNEGVVVESWSGVEDDFFADVFLDSSDAQSGDTRASSDQTLSPGVVQENKGSDVEEDNSAGENSEKERIDPTDPEDVQVDEPLCKKRKRQLRNRDSAMRSRERKKLYVRDLELKSKYLEGELRRLQYALSCCAAENQLLQHQLQARMAYDASVPKQESAALPLESLLLGSLFWLMSFVCLFLMPFANLISPVQKMSDHQVGHKAAEKRPENEEEATKLQSVFGLAWTRRRWKSTKWRMKWAAGYLSSVLWL